MQLAEGVVRGCPVSKHVHVGQRLTNRPPKVGIVLLLERQTLRCHVQHPDEAAAMMMKSSQTAALVLLPPHDTSTTTIYAPSAWLAHVQVGRDTTQRPRCLTKSVVAQSPLVHSDLHCRVHLCRDQFHQPPARTNTQKRSERLQSSHGHEHGVNKLRRQQTYFVTASPTNGSSTKFLAL